MNSSFHPGRRVGTALTIFALALAGDVVRAQSIAAVSEKDFLSDMPTVLSVSRLPQRLDETPGALTILDRDMIRRSGARDVADLLRLVPGFQTSTSFESDAPQASYHGVLGIFSPRIQVLVDGRSVYSTYFFGSVAFGLMSVALNDIERIEVFRGSNSAAYGARAMLGVINIVTRHSSDAAGVHALVTQGSNGIKDAALGLGWGASGATMRLSVDQRSDDGLTGSNGHNQVQRVNWRADLATSADTQWELRAGWMKSNAGRGFANDVDSPLRVSTYTAGHAQVDWKKVLDSEQDLALTFAHNQETFFDLATYALPAPFYSVDLDYSGTASNDSLMLQHTRRLTGDVRVVWGGELRRESVTSRPIYNTSEPLNTNFQRIFSNLEWRFQPNWLLNAGAMAEHSSDSGSSLAPRVMVNWHVTPDQTLRAGIARSFRPPSLLESKGNIRYTAANQLLRVTIWPRGNVSPEAVLTRELGYLAALPGLESTLDVRVFDEAISGLIQRQTYSLPAGTSVLPSSPFDFTNGDNFSIRGIEVQWKAQPWQGANVGLNLATSKVFHVRPLADDLLTGYVPTSSYTLRYDQRFAMGWEIGLSHQHSDPVALPRSSDYRGSLTRTDLRLAKALRWGAHRGELALVVQNMGAPYADYKNTFLFEKQAFVTLRFQD